MSEETNNEGGLSGLKKTIIGTLGTIITAGGVWLTTQLGGDHSEDKEEVKTEQVAPAPAAAPVVINLQNNNTNYISNTFSHSINYSINYSVYIHN